MQLLTQPLRSSVKSETSNQHMLFVLLLSVVMLCLVVSIAWAGNPGEGATTTGQPLRIQIVEPVLGQGFVPGTAITLTGQAVIGALNAPASLLYVVDVSSSTQEPVNQDCNGNGSTDSGDNLNNNAFQGDTLDCEISGVIALNQSLVSSSIISAGIILFAESAAAADTNPQQAGRQPFSPVQADQNNNTSRDLEEVSRSLTTERVGQFTPITVPGGTDFNDALTTIAQTFATQSAPHKIAYFLSDGEHYEPLAGPFLEGPTSPLATVAQAGITVNTYSVGGNGTGCGATAALRKIADRTGGVCTAVIDPSKLNTVLPGTRPTGIDHVEITVNNSAPISATLDTLGNWAAVITACATPNEPIVATVVATDGTRVAADIRLCPPTSLDEEKEPTDPNNTASRLFLPVVVKE